MPASKRPSTITTVERERRAVELRRAGLTFDAIADAMGLANRSVAYKLVNRGLQRWAQPATDELRALELERTDALIRRLWPLVDTAEPDLAVLDRLLRVLDYRARLTGLYAPQQQVFGVEVRGEIHHHKLEALAVVVGQLHHPDPGPPADAPTPAAAVGDRGDNQGDE